MHNKFFKAYVDRAAAAIEAMHLPAPRIAKEETSTRVTLFPYKDMGDMTKGEKTEACYQHACLLNEDGLTMNNQSVRERFNLNKTQPAVASRIIADTLEAGLIKISNADITSQKICYLCSVLFRRSYEIWSNQYLLKS